ncbi:MAG: GbsR/MarR family transcriptional regulator [Pseudomonadales bacterium]
MQMSEKIEAFVYHFGEMGSKWGFNRTVGQMYALLVVSDKALNANQIGEALNVSRGNISMGLKELMSWQLISLSHIPGDRKEYYSPKGSIWDMANRVFEERRKREMDPTLSLLRNLQLDNPQNDSDAYAQAKMREIHDLLETVTQWSAELQRLDPDKLNTLMKLGAGVSKVLSIKDQLIKPKGVSNDL